MKVKITVRRLVEYSRIHEIPEDRFDLLNHALKSGDRAAIREAEKTINNFIRPSEDWQDDDLHSVDEFEPENI